MNVPSNWWVLVLLGLGWILLWRWRKRSVTARARVVDQRLPSPPMTERQFLVAITAKLEDNLAYYQQIIDSYAPEPAPLHWVRNQELTADRLAGYRAQLVALDAPAEWAAWAARGKAEGGGAGTEGVAPTQGKPS